MISIFLNSFVDTTGTDVLFDDELIIYLRDI